MLIFDNDDYDDDDVYNDDDGVNGDWKTGIHRATIYSSG